MGNGDIDVKSKGKDLKEEMGGGEGDWDLKEGEFRRNGGGKMDMGRDGWKIRSEERDDGIGRSFDVWRNNRNDYEEEGIRVDKYR